MRLISCYIIGFGRFKDCTFDLSKDLMIFKEDNGWGKTTFADFLKCMLYGMDNGRGRSVEKNERMKYEPWEGGVFGGVLTFSCVGKTYRVERTFGKTAAGDTAKFYDENNALCYDFGQNGELLGERLFGMDRESFSRSVYFPQGEIKTGALPDDIKGRLMALLGGANSEEGAGRAMEKLETAERALRAKRKPAKGKLDEIDERLQALYREKNDCDRFAVEGAQAQANAEALRAEIERINAHIGELALAIEQGVRRSEAVAKRAAYEDWQRRMVDVERDLQALQVFFKEGEPNGVNIDGLQNAVTEFYHLQAELTKHQAEMQETELRRQEMQNIEERLAEKSREKAEFDLTMERRRAFQTQTEKKTPLTLTLWAVGVLGAILAVFGGVQIVDKPSLGYALLGLGGVGVLYALIHAGIVGRKRRKGRALEDTLPADWNEKRMATEAEWAFLQGELQRLQAEMSTREGRATTYQQMQQRAEGLEKGICEFLDHFRFEELYDYRMAITTLREKIAAYGRCKQQKAECSARLAEYTTGDESWREATPSEDLPMLRAQKAEAEHRKEELVAKQASFAMMAQEMRTKSNKEELLSAENYWTAEKERLEKRLYAIRMAKEFLARAQENMATRYLDCVQRNCRAYLQSMGEDAETLRFAADGSALIEKTGQLRGVECFSVGVRELVGFCTRLALVDAMFTQEKPMLILDDPFVNLDDKKTERAKKLTKELSKTYQVFYFTCKKEREI